MSDKNRGIDMTSDEMRSVLAMTTGYSFEYLQSLNHEELKKLYEEKTNVQVQR
jgi:hypothetical protein